VQDLPVQYDFPPVVSGKSIESLGSIVLNVVFGRNTEFCKEALHLEVVDFKSSFYAIFEHRAYAKFMAQPCYTYVG
jgi:hypothetical protein